jgi:diguanylate cyclase (GGDEF)-like protein
VTAVRNKKKTALLFLDLDKFKSVNDTLGHLAGDALLLSVAERLKSCVREADTICRQGGDEFMILLPEIGGAEDAERVARKIVAAMAEPHHIVGRDLIVTFSIGISVCPDDATDEETMIKHADDAMYRAKEQGRNNFQFN